MKKTTSFIRKLFELRLFLVVNVLLLFFLSLSFGREYIRNASIQKDIDALESEKQALEARNLDILSVSETIQSQFFLEKEGRVKHGLKKPGEKLVIITDNLDNGYADAAADSGINNGEENKKYEAQMIGNSKRWYWYFFDRSKYKELRQYEFGS